MSKSPEIFKRDLEEYKSGINPTKNYIQQASYYVNKKTGKPMKECRDIVIKLIKKNESRNPTVSYRYKQDNGDIVKKEDSLTDYIKESLSENEIIAPSFTTYLHPSVKKSIHAEFLADNIAARSKDKKMAFEFKQKGDEDKFMYYNTLQKTRKVFNNSLSGAYASKSTIIYNPSAHYTLTSMTRSVTSIGNAVSESMIAGNKHFKDPDTVLNYIVSIVSTLSKDDKESKATVMAMYNIHVPTTEEIVENILKSSSKYWVDDVAMNNISKFLDTLDNVEKAMVAYNNDLYTLRKYNDELIREFIGNLGKRVTTGSTDNLADINKAKEGIMNLVHHVCASDIKGMNVNYKKMEGTDTLNILASTAKNIDKVLTKFGPLIKEFFVTDIMPPTIAYIKDMYRDVIVLSDTDSTCGSYDEWVEWYLGKISFDDIAVGISAAVMTINTQVIDHYLKIFTANMNVDKKDVELIKMKNEFYWDVFTSTNVSKHYFANVKIQEGNVFDKPDLELKGVHLIASNVDKNIRDQAHQMIKDLQNDVTSGDKVDLYKYIKKTADVERKIISDIKAGGINIFKMDKIKEEKSYKLDRTRSPYLHHLLWHDVFASKYGSPGEPTYMVINIPTVLQSKRSTKEFLDTVEDKEIQESLKNFLQVRNKDSLGTFRVPLTIASEKGLPEEMFNAIDIHKVVTNSTNVFYMILESFGFYRKPNMLISEMGY